MRLSLFLAFVTGGVLLVASFLPACGTEATPTPTPTSTPIPLPLTAQEIIRRSSEEMEKITSFRFELDHLGGGTPIGMRLVMQKAVGDVVRPDRMRALISASVGSIPFEVEVITVGETTYMTNPLSGKMEPLPTEFSAVSLFDPDTGITTIMRRVTGLERLEDGVAGDVPSYQLRGTIDSSDLRPIAGGSVLEGVTIRAEVWIGKADFLVRRITFEGQITGDEREGIIRTLKVSNYNQEVSIELPE